MAGMDEKAEFGVVLTSGAAAGLAADVVLFPLDTLKTRLQSAEGFWRVGGVRGMYAGLASLATGSMPSAAIFFCTYEGIKSVTSTGRTSGLQVVGGHMAAAMLAEVASCVVRVPCEVIKQRTQTLPNVSSWHVFQLTMKRQGVAGLFQGYTSTVMREVPFALLQYPLWELFKNVWGHHQGGSTDPWQSAICAGVAGGVSAGVTTPLDVAKTRIMLAGVGTPLASSNLLYALKAVNAERGISGLFAGLIPRIVLVSLGGAIFLGSYDKIKDTMVNYNCYAHLF